MSSLYRFSCDEDGFMFQANTELPYPHFFHLFSPDMIQTVQVVGDVLISYIGFGNKGTASFTNKNLGFMLCAFPYIPKQRQFILMNPKTFKISNRHPQLGSTWHSCALTDRFLTTTGLLPPSWWWHVRLEPKSYTTSNTSDSFCSSQMVSLISQTGMDSAVFCVSTAAFNQKYQSFLTQRKLVY